MEELLVMALIIINSILLVSWFLFLLDYQKGKKHKDSLITAQRKAIEDLQLLLKNKVQS